MKWIRARTFDRLMLSFDDINIPFDEIQALPWVAVGVASLSKLSLGIEIVLGRYVGRIVIPDSVVIDIEEIVPGTVAACLTIAMPRAVSANWKSAAAGPQLLPWLAIITSYADQLGSYVTDGVERKYLKRVAVQQRPRGRISVRRTVLEEWARGRTHHVVATPRVLTDNTAFNRALSAASARAEQVLMGISGSEDVTRSLRRSVQALPPSSLRWDYDEFEERVEVESRYEELRQLAEVILGGVPVSPPLGLDEVHLPVTAWLNVDRLFEDAVVAVIRRLEAESVSVRRGAGDGVCLLVSGPNGPPAQRIDAQPDVVVRSGDRVMILDAKYRRHGEHYSHSELYQLMAHCRAYGASGGALISPALWERPQVRWLGRDREGTGYSVISVDAADKESYYGQIGAWLDRN